MGTGFALQILPVGAFTAKVAVSLLALLSFASGNLAWRRVKSAYEDDGEIPRQYSHVFFNVVTLLAAALLVANPETSHTGWIVLMFAVAAFVSGIFTYRGMLVQMDRGDDSLDLPSMHAAAGLVLVLYTFYTWLWELVGVGGFIFA